MEKEEEFFYHYLSKEAADRYSRVKAIDKERAEKIKKTILDHIKAGKITTLLSEKEFLKIANGLCDDKKMEFNITRRKSYLDF